MAGIIENRNYYEEKREIRRMCHKTAIKKEDIKLEYDYESPQEERRRILLKSQKKSRDDTVNTARGVLFENFISDDETETMDVENYTSQNQTYRRKYRSKVMMSEWMLEPPQDFVENWIMVPCPIGKRIVLAASRGITKACDRKGRRISTFQSALPGGNYKSIRAQFTILDCIWVKDMKTYYVLDIIAWAKQPTINWEAELRFFWVNSHLNEIKALQTHDPDINEYAILPLPNIACSADLCEALTTDSHFPLDGLLFYHRNGHYMFGESPLVTWLKPFMLPEILGIFITPPFDGKPDGYVDYKHYIYHSTKNIKKKKYFCVYFGIEKEDQ